VWGIGMSYSFLLQKLRHDIKLLKLEKKKLKLEQIAMLEFIEGRKHIAQFHINHDIITVSRGDHLRGFEHILLRHYCDECSGVLSAREIVNMGFLLSQGRELTSFELNERGTKGYELIKQDNIRLRVILNRDGLLERVLSYYSNR
jgi:hypothetical protein